MKQLCQKLFRAIRRGVVRNVLACIAQGVDIETRLRNGQTPLLYAIAHKKIDVACVLLIRNANIEARDNNERTALILAVEKNMLEMADILLNRGVDVNTRKYCYEGADECDPRHWSDSALIIAAKQNNYPMAKLLLEYGADPLLNEECEGGTALHYARDPRLVQMLIDYKADVNDVRYCYGTPLMAAAFNHNSEKAKILLKSGADIYIVNGSEGTAAHVAANSGCFSVLKLLLDAQYNVHYEVQRTLSVLWHGSIGISANDIQKLFKLLLTYGYNVNKKYRGIHDFMHLVLWLPLKTVKAIIKAGADIHAIDDKGKSVLGYINRHSEAKNLKYLFSLGIKMNKFDEERLFFCVENNLLDILQVLIENGANIHAVNAESYSLVDYANKIKSNDAIKLIKESISNKAT